MAWNTPTSVSPGDAILASLYNEDVVDNLTELAPFFGAWTSYTPTVWQGAATPNITKTVTQARYVKVGKLVHLMLAITVTGTGTANQILEISLPSGVEPTGAFNQALGAAQIFDSSTNTLYMSLATWLSSDNRFGFVGDWAGGGLWGTIPNLAVANGDVIRANLTYEVA